MLIFFVPRILLPVLHRAGTMKPYSAMHTPSKNKSMIKSFRLCLSRWMPSGIKAAECNLCHIIHIYIHLFQISLQQCLNKRIIITI